MSAADELDVFAFSVEIRRASRLTSLACSALSSLTWRNSKRSRAFAALILVLRELIILPLLLR